VLDGQLSLLTRHADQNTDDQLPQTIADIKFSLKSMNAVPQTSWAVAELEKLIRPDDLLSRLLRPLPVLTLLFAALAISSKIGLARNDLRKEQEAKAKGALRSRIPLPWLKRRRLRGGYGRRRLLRLWLRLRQN
jgi:hypothetical protein